MGALRAAELDSFGMVGIGAIYRAYRDGVLEDDDEVAVAHRTAEEGFAPTSEPMVDIRWTLEAAALAGVIDDQVAMRSPTSRNSSSTRSVPTGASSRSADATVSRIPGDWTTLKHGLSATRCIRSAPTPSHSCVQCGPGLRRHRSRSHSSTRSSSSGRGAPPEPSPWRNEQRQQSTQRGTVGSPSPASTVTLEALLDELKLQPDLYHELKLRAVARCLAARERARDTRRSESDLQIALDRFRRSHDLAQPAATREWMVENEVSLSQLAALAQEDAALSDATTQLEGELDIYLRNELRSRDLYAALAERARDKQHVLGRLGAADASFDQVDDDEVVQWHFQSIGTPTPSDLSAYMRGLGYSDPVVFLRTLKREYSYQYGSLAASDGSSPQPRVGRPAHD